MTEKTFDRTIKIKEGHEFKAECNIYSVPEKTFEEQFPSCVNVFGYTYSIIRDNEEIKNMMIAKCLDKQKVRDARDRLVCKFTFKLNQSTTGKFNLIELIEPDWEDFEKEIGLRCEKCNQIEEHSGEYPCQKCGRPTLWDEKELGL